MNDDNLNIEFNRNAYKKKNNFQSKLAFVCLARNQTRNLCTEIIITNETLGFIPLLFGWHNL